MSGKDLTQGKPIRLIASFALPMLVGNIFQQLYSMADSIIVGRFVSVGALASIGATSSVLYLMIAIIIGFNVGVAITTSQFVGAKDEKSVRDTVGTAVLITLALSVSLAILGNLFADAILRLLNTPSDIFEGAHTYLSINFASCIGPISYNMFSSIIRSSGDSKNPLIALIISSLTNIALDLLFVLAFDMGVAGVALATGIAQLISALYCIIILRMRYPALWCRWENIKYNKSILGRILKFGVPMALQSFFTSVGGMFIQRTVNAFGSAVVAGYTAAEKLSGLALEGVMSLGEAMSVYSGQNTGANRPDRVRQGVTAAWKLGFMVSLAFTAIIWFAGPKLVLLFVSAKEAEVILVAKQFLQAVCPFYVISCGMYIYSNTLRGMGRVALPTAASLIELGVKTLAALLLSWWAGQKGIWFAWPIGWLSALLLLCAYYYGFMRKNSKTAAQTTEM